MRSLDEESGGSDFGKTEEFTSLAQTIFDLPIRTVIHHIHEICVAGDDNTRDVTLSSLHQLAIPGAPRDTITIATQRTSEGYESSVSMRYTMIVHGVRQSFVEHLFSIHSSPTEDMVVCAHESRSLFQCSVLSVRHMLKTILLKIVPDFELDEEGSTLSV